MAGLSTDNDTSGPVGEGDTTGQHLAGGSDELIPVPSGQPVTLLDVIRTEAGPAGLAVRFRFLAPEIAREGGGISFDTAAEDMAALCTGYALPRVGGFGPQPAQIIISMSDQALPFGEAAPEATQYFEAYSIEGDTCIWEMF